MIFRIPTTLLLVTLVLILITGLTQCGLSIYDYFHPIYLQYGLLDHKGNFIIPPHFDELSERANGQYTGLKHKFDINWSVQVFDHKGKLLRQFTTTIVPNDRTPIIPDIGLDQPNAYDYAGERSSNDKNLIRKVKKDRFQRKMIGYKNLSGDWIINPHYWDTASQFSQGLAFVWLKGKPYGKWGIINTKGKYILKPTCAHIWPLVNGRAKCQVAYRDGKPI